MNLRSVPAELDAPFLSAKVQPPTRANALVTRDRLTRLVIDGQAAKLTVISGPAGSGKTYLLSDWAESSDQDSIGWLKLDATDNDPSQFWLGVLGSLASVAEPQTTQHLSTLTNLIRSDLRTFLSSLGEVLDKRKRVTLVLDDLHRVTNEDIHAGLELILEHLSGQLRVVVATRTTPPLGLPRLRARGELCEVRFEDLRFSVPESIELLERVSVGPVSERTALRLQEDTNGWAAALYVAAIGLETAEDSDQLTARIGQNRHLSEYLVEEVLGREPPERQEFLLETSILTRLSADRCNALTGRTDSAELLRQLQSSSQFVTSVGRDGSWYVYHDLLRDLLRQQLKLQSAERWSALHGLAARVALDEADPADAIHHAIEADDLPTAAATIANSWIGFTNRGLFATVMSWLDRWQAAAAAQGDPAPSDPTIFIVGSWMALHTGRLSEVEPWLVRAEAHDHTGPLPDGTRSVAAAVAIVRCSFNRRIGRLDASLAAGREAVAEESDESSPWRAVACVGHASSLYWAGETDVAREFFGEARRIGSAASLLVPVLLADGYGALIARMDGDGDRAMSLAAEAVSLAESKDLGGYDQAAPAYLAIGLCLLEQVQLDQAESNLRIALRLARQGGERLLEAAVHLGLLRLAQLRSQPEVAAIERDNAKRIIEQCPEPGHLLTSRLAASDHAAQSPGTIGAVPQLTERELTVLRYLQSELTLKEIAAELFVSANTIKTHTSAIRSKLAVRSRQEAVRAARELGLLN